MNILKQINFILKTSSLIIFLLVTFISCTMKPETDDNSAALLFLLEGGNASTIPCTSAPANAISTSGSSTFTSTVNASSACAWIYVSLKSNGVAVASTAQWDIAFKRYNVATNSGTSGSGSGGACYSGSSNFSAAYNGSECTAVVDVKLTSAGGGPVSASSDSINPVMAAPLDLTPMPSGYGSWYTYADTILTAKTNVYIVTGSDGSKYVVQMLDYYSAAGTSGYPKFQWKKI